jgi:protein CpxP
MKKSSLSVGISLLAVFLSGAVVGAFGHRLYMVRSVYSGLATVRQPTPPKPEEFRKKYVEELRTRLQLDEPQLAKLNTILDQTREKFHQVRERSKERSKSESMQVRQEQRSQIRAMLKPEQQPEYEKVIQERDNRERERQEKERQKANEKP